MSRNASNFSIKQIMLMFINGKEMFLDKDADWLCDRHAPITVLQSYFSAVFR